MSTSLLEIKPKLSKLQLTKTACKYYDNKELFEEKLKSVEGAMERYLLNKKIIDFNEIPEELIKQFKEIYNIL